jgi:hypothetical protein
MIESVAGLVPEPEPVFVGVGFESRDSACVADIRGHLKEFPSAFVVGDFDSAGSAIPRDRHSASREDESFRTGSRIAALVAFVRIEDKPIAIQAGLPAISLASESDSADALRDKCRLQQHVRPVAAFPSITALHGPLPGAQTH